MKKIIFSVLAILILTISTFGIAEARLVKVKSYFRSNGTYVPSYYRTSPNKSRYDNWSTKGNYNPYTGKKGYVSPFRW